MGGVQAGCLSGLNVHPRRSSRRLWCVRCPPRPIIKTKHNRPTKGIAIRTQIKYMIPLPQSQQH
jgi:hypothetical protein